MNSDGQFAIEGGRLRLAPIESATPLVCFEAMESEKGPSHWSTATSKCSFHLRWVLRNVRPDITLQQQTKTRQY